MNKPTYTLFISDLHLDRRDITLSTSFLFFMRDHVDAEAIYILGDFFNAFIGEDDNNSYVEQIKASCRTYTQAGGKLYIMAGNRDFLMQTGFANSVGGTYIPDPTMHTIYGLKCLLMHGDSLCTDDIQHQKWRNVYTRSWAHGVAHLIPLKIRQWLAKRMRKHSKARKATQDLSIMDTNPQAVLKAITDANCDYLIHGHTHRPQDHGRRLVLGAWPDADSIIKLASDHTFTRLSPNSD